MSAASVPNTPATSDNDAIVVTRLFDAPPETVFAAWVDPRQLEHWWGPGGFRAEVLEADIREGGVARLVLWDTNGDDYPVIVSFLEITPPSRLVYRNSGEGRSTAPPFIATITFDAEAGGTRVTLSMLVASPSERDTAINDYGALEGGNQMLARLASHLRTSRKDTTTMATPAVGKTNTFIEGDRKFGFERLFDAPRELVFEAYSSAEHIKRWWGPEGWPTVVCNIDFRVGGTWHYCMKGPDGTEAWGIATYKEIVRPELITYMDAFSDADANIVPPEMEVTMQFENHDGKTLVRSISTFDSPEGLKTVIEMGMEQGMDETLDHLDTYLEELKTKAR